MKRLNVEKVKELCSAKQWPQNELARRADLAKGTISEIFRHRNPTLRALSQIAEALGVDENEILEHVDEDEQHHAAAC